MQRCVEEGVQRRGRGCGDVWRKVRCRGSVRMGVGGRKFVGAGAGVRCGGRAGGEMCGGRRAAEGASS